MVEVALGVFLFTVIVMCLVLLVLLAQRLLVLRGEVAVRVNDSLELRARIGTKLHSALIEQGVQVPSACGGTGTCGLCGILVTLGVTHPGPADIARIPAAKLRAGMRLACQVTLREDLEVRVPETLLNLEPIECVVQSNRNVSTFMKELRLALPPGKHFDFQAGAFVQVSCPKYRASFAEFEIDPPYDAEWERRGLRNLEAQATEPTVRAYSLANHRGEETLQLIVRIATPPPGAPPKTPPGIVSSWIFGLSPGDTVNITGPFGHFFATDSDREMIFVGGGAGMAPMRSHILDQLERLGSGRKISFWYGARSRGELFYVEEFDQLAAEHENFAWHPALSEPKPDEEWEGATGFIHQVLIDEYLTQHPAPEQCEYYLCGPPMMVRETRRVLDELGVDPDDVHFDDFGGSS